MKPTLRAMLVVAAGALAALGGWLLYNKLREQAKSEPQRPKRRPHEEGPHADDADGPAQVMPHVNAPRPDPDAHEVDPTPPADADGAHHTPDEQPHGDDEAASNADGDDLPPAAHVADDTIDSSDGPAAQEPTPTDEPAQRRSSEGTFAPADEHTLNSEDVDEDVDDGPDDPPERDDEPQGLDDADAASDISEPSDDTDSSGHSEDDDKDEPPVDDGAPGDSHGG